MTPGELDRVAPAARPGLRVLPVLHERVDLAGLVRQVLEVVDPAVVAVELPTTVAAAAAQAVARLPRLSVVVSETAGEDALVWVVAPGDPLVEAMRWAGEQGRAVVCVDPDVPYRERHRDPLPDPHTHWTLGAATWSETLRSVAGRRPASDSDRLRERGMAHALQQAAATAGGEVLALVGAAHAARLAEDLQGPTAPALARRHRDTVTVRHLHPDSLTAVLQDPPLAHGVWELIRSGEVPPSEDLAAAVAPRMELVRHGLTVIAGGFDEDRSAHREAMLRFAAHHAARRLPDGPPAVDRSALARAVWRLAAAGYREQTRDDVARWQSRVFFDFARRYARTEGLLVPGLYELVVAARGAADDNLAWEVFDAARCYPWQQERAEIETARVDGEMLDLGSRRVSFRRRFFRVKQRPVRIPVRQRPTAEDPAAWLEAFDSGMLCSYPPEDVVIEDYGRFLQQKAISNLTAESARSEPFSTSMLDGLDLRETLAHWHEGRVWVREVGRVPGAAGSVVVVFDPDPGGERFPYLMTWLGEHDQESDMAFYATDPTRQIVGPGIMRATHGGFMLTYPPGRLADVWRDPDYREAASKPEVLVMAAIDYSSEPLVVHVAAAPPAERLKARAARQRKRLVHIPLGSLSPVTLRRIRVLHILAGHDTRAVARDYIW